MKKIHSIGIAAVICVWLGLTLMAWFGPDAEFSAAERRKLARFPSLTVNTVLSGRFMSEFETYGQDQFPLRDQFRQLKSMFHYFVLRQRDNHGIYLADGYAAALEYPLDQKSVAYAADLFNQIYENHLAGAGSRILFAVAPDKSYYLAEPNGFPAMDYDALSRQLQDALPWAEFVEIADCLSGQDYYRTDTHWRQERLIPAAQKLAEALEVTPPREEDFTVTAIDRPFYGVYYGQAALPMAAETIYTMNSPVIDGCTVENYETGQTASVYDLTKLDSRDLYDIYLSGAAALLTIENPGADTDRELIVFRDSFGSSLIPLLLADYHTVTVVDLRYFPSAMLGSQLTFDGQDVLFLYSPLVLNKSYSLR